MISGRLSAVAGRVGRLSIVISSLPLALARGWIEAAAFAYALPESFPLLGRHGVPAIAHAIGEAIGHATADSGATGTVESKSAEEDPA